MQEFNHQSSATSSESHQEETHALKQQSVKDGSFEKWMEHLLIRAANKASTVLR
jgi:hypothetical protein